MKTIAEAAKLLCPVMTRHGGAINCEGAFCMAWRWADPEPAAPFSDWVFAEFGDETGEGTPEPPRPETVPAHWDWVPVSVE
ncbi:MAG: hypothetical protein EBZ50_16120, partial [Alphaproteobacteria bacterium]|nr:hypothetical protein [Alphaproteobacteria bacterium]